MGGGEAFLCLHSSRESDDRKFEISDFKGKGKRQSEPRLASNSEKTSTADRCLRQAGLVAVLLAMTIGILGQARVQAGACTLSNRERPRLLEFAEGGGEDFGVAVDVGGGGGGRHERHVVKRREEDAAVKSVKVHEALEFEIHGRGGFAPIVRRNRGELIFGAAAKARDMPRQTGISNGGGDARSPALGEGNHARESFRGEDILERGAHGGE
jgi:hypothetical protein